MQGQLRWSTRLQTSKQSNGALTAPRKTLVLWSTPRSTLTASQTPGLGRKSTRYM